jgi:hypothetical protein
MNTSELCISDILERIIHQKTALIRSLNTPPP